MESMTADMSALPPTDPLGWVRRLDRALNDRQRHVELCEAYYSGHHPLAFATNKFRSTFGGLFDGFADNWTALVVDAVEERLNIDGFRLGGDAVDGDKAAWGIWQDNQLDADSQVAHTEALKSGVAYALVWVGDTPSGVEITIEHPSQMIVAYSSGSRRRRSAALKRWLDDSGFVFATLYLPDGIYKFRSASKRNAASVGNVTSKWVARESTDEAWPLPNPLGVVPVVPLVNRPRLLLDAGRCEGESELQQVMPMQDAANKLLADMLVASEFAAFRQRWATGLEIPRDPETDQPIESFQHAINRLWVSEDPNTKFGEFTPTDLENYVKAIQMIVQHIASQTRTPPHYFYLSGQFPSGESIKSAETGLVAKARRKMRHFGEAWEEVIRLSFAVIGDKERAAVTDSEVIWGDPESRIESEHVDAVIKRRALLVPLRQLWSDVGYSPTQIDRFVAWLDEEKATPVIAAEEPTPTETIGLRA